MKKILFVLAFALPPAFTYGQGYPKEGNTYIVILPDSIDPHKKALEVLTNRGYFINSKKEVSSLIITKRKRLEGITRAVYTLEINGHEIIITGNYTSLTQISRRAWSNYEKTTNAPMVITWLEMVEIAKALGGKRDFEMR